MTLDARRLKKQLFTLMKMGKCSSDHDIFLAEDDKESMGLFLVYMKSYRNKPDHES